MAVSKTAALRKIDGDFGEIRLDLAERSFYRFSMLATQLNRCVTGAYVEKFARPANAWKVLTLLGRFGPISVSEITAHTSLEMDKVTRVVDSLVRQGLTVRKQDSADKRRIIIYLTAKGRKVVRQIETMIYEMEREFLIALSAEERETLYTVLDKLQTRAKQIFSGKAPWKKFI
jgi:DNA-binding MarR family transcriptional regulator